MKKYINLNALFAEYFVRSLYKIGVRDCVISPGSRNTPLTIALDSSKKIKKHVVIDERSNAYFALGISNASKRPVAIFTTSGTATAELYPAIIEAFYQRVPLIVCTADRPIALTNTGANQTINQWNLYANHIKGFHDSNEIKASVGYFKSFNSNMSRVLNEGLLRNRGPVHFNLRFDKPLEKSNFTHCLDNSLLDFINNLKPEINIGRHLKSREFAKAIKLIKNKKRIIIFAGPQIYDKDYIRYINKIAQSLNAPVFADGLSGLRVDNQVGKRIITCSTAFLRNRKFGDHLDPDLILQFGNSATSNISQYFYENSKATKVLINEFGEIKDSSNLCDMVLASTPKDFFDYLISTGLNIATDRDWSDKLFELEKFSSELKNSFLENADFPSEPAIMNKLFTRVSRNSVVMISNSIPPRDLDFFGNTFKKNVRIYHNRGTSGIDGIISTAAGLAKASGKNTYLIIGDLSFLHDLNGLWLLKKYKIPLKIILINNGGGSIFEMLPIAKEKVNFREYYKVPPEMDFGKIVTAFDGIYLKPDTWEQLDELIMKESKNFTVIELATDSHKSLELRKNYWDSVIQGIEEQLNEYPDR